MSYRHIVIPSILVLIGVLFYAINQLTLMLGMPVKTVVILAIAVGVFGLLRG